MTYSKNVWKDQDVQRPRTYEVINNQDGSITLNDSFGVVTEIGTPVNATNMNHIEDGIQNNDIAISAINDKIPSSASSSNKMAVASDIAAINTALTLKADKTQLHALKGYLDDGEVLTDAEGLADVVNYAHSTYDSTKFTVVGSPTITDDGIASGFSSGNYITVDTSNIDFDNANTWEIDFKIRLNNNTTATQMYFDTFEPGVSSIIRFDYYNENNQNSFRLTLIASDGTRILNYGTVQQNIVVDTWYTFKIIYTGTHYIVRDAAGNQLKDIESSKKVNLTSRMLVGKRQANDQPVTNGSIDLKQFSITVDGVPVFSGNKTGTDTYTIGGNTVTIPYTLSKTGSKIASANSRTDVTALYNQQGYSPYYTLDEANGNFTLPQGEIYGMMLNQSVPHVVESYANQVGSVMSWYRVYSDGWCVQGASSFGTNYPDITTETTINLLKPYKSVNYFIGGVGFVIESTGRQNITAITPSSFTTSHDSAYPLAGTNSWWTAGYINI